MTQFQMPLASNKAYKEYKSLDYFTQGYVEAMFFTDSDDRDDELYGLGYADLAPEALSSIVAECARFQTAFKALLDEAMRSPSYDHEDDGYSLIQAGRDFWFSRNGHGVGFWDRGLGNVGNELHKAAKAFGEAATYKGDDGQIYIA